MAKITVAFWVFVFVLAGTGEAEAGDADSCLRALSKAGVRYQRVDRVGVKIGVTITDNKLGGVEYVGYEQGKLVIDCSLAVSLAKNGLFLRRLGIEKITYSSAYQRRNIRGTNRPSRHSYGLAIDLHTFHVEGLGSLRIRDDYEQGLGTIEDCVGQPLTEQGALLRTIDCELAESGDFRIILSPDYDAHHYNHFHVEVLPWDEERSK